MNAIGGRDVGWVAVRGSFEQVAKLASKGKIGLKDQFICFVGGLAYEVGIERGQFMLGGEKIAIDRRVTNIYEKLNGM